MDLQGSISEKELKDIRQKLMRFTAEAIDNYFVNDPIGCQIFLAMTPVQLEELNDNVERIDPRTTARTGEPRNPQDVKEGT